MKKNRTILSKAMALSFIIVLIFSILPSNLAQAVELNPVDQEPVFNLATQTVNEMGVGWNLGNTLDAFSSNLLSYEIAQQKRSNYQIMATYSTKTYSGWDASQAPYIPANGSEFVLNWKISKLNSGATNTCGKFAFQIINQSLKDSGTNTLDFTVTKAQFTTVNGVTIILEDMLGDYLKTIQKGVTSYVVADLTMTNLLATTADILGGTLTVAVKINDYPNPKEPTMTKEAHYEKLFGNPLTTKAMIDMVKQKGFGAVRIPVTYYNHIDDQGNIDAAWLKRVEEVVNYVLENEMHCIINVHHDTGDKGWLKADLNTLDVTGARFQDLWSQIATYFKDYDEKLLFEGYNELLNSKNQWSWAGVDSYLAANNLNQIFVDAVRSTGSNNSQRCLIVNTYAASAEEEVIKNFVLPQDTVEDRLIVGAHYYGTSTTGITNVLNRLNKYFVQKGIPVIIGECGTTWKMAEADRVSYSNYIVSNAKKMNITCFWWDDGNYVNKVGAKCNFAILDKCALQWYHPTIAQALVNSSKAE